MSKLSGCSKETQYRWDNCQISQSDCTTKIPSLAEVQKCHQTPFPLAVLKGGLGMTLISLIPRPLPPPPPQGEAWYTLCMRIISPSF